MRKKITKYGNSLVISFTKNECELYGIKEGDIIDIEDMLIFAKKKTKKEVNS